MGGKQGKRVEKAGGPGSPKGGGQDRQPVGLRAEAYLLA